MIISDDDKALKGALDSLKDKREWNGCHLLDVYHVLANCKKNLTNKSYFPYFARLAKAHNAADFRAIAEQAVT